MNPFVSSKRSLPNHGWAITMCCRWCAFVNSFIHTLMYSNYLLKSLGQKVWWAKYLTQGQIVQFITGTIYSGAFLLMQRQDYGCTGDARTAIVSNLVNFSFIVLFVNVSIHCFCPDVFINSPRS